MTGHPKHNGSGPARRAIGASRPSAGGATGKPDVAGSAPALPFSERMSDPGYSGEVQRLGLGLRPVRPLAAGASLAGLSPASWGRGRKAATCLQVVA